MTVIDVPTDFGGALELLRAGHRVTRTGWRVPGKWLVLVPGSSITITEGRPLGDAAPELVGRQVTYRAHVDIFNADGEVVPWAPSQSDILARDWVPVDGHIKGDSP